MEGAERENTSLVDREEPPANGRLSLDSEGVEMGRCCPGKCFPAA